MVDKKEKLGLGVILSMILLSICLIGGLIYTHADIVKIFISNFKQVFKLNRFIQFDLYKLSLN